MKLKLLFIIITAVVMASTISVGAYNNEKIVNVESYEFAVAFLEDLYQNSYLYEENDLTQYVKSESLLKYLEGYQNIRRVIATDYRYYGLEYELLDCVTSGDYVYYEIMHTATIKYKNDEVTVSKATNAAFVIVENTPEGYVVKDWILPAHDDYYVGSMRGFDLNSLIKPELSDPCYWDEITVDSKMLDTIDSLIETQQKRQNGETILDVPAEPKIETFGSTIAPYRVFYLNRAAIVAWAEANYYKDTPTSGNSSIIPQYYDFSEITNNYDCTNFASHALLAGGAIMYDTGDASTGWFYNSLSDRSYSWSGVPYFGSFLINNRVKGPGGVEMTYTNITNGNYVYQEGDIIQYYYNGRWNHTAIVTGFRDVGNGELEALVTYRSSDSSRNVDIAQSYYGAAATRVIRLLGYYPGDGLN